MGNILVIILDSFVLEMSIIFIYFLRFQFIYLFSSPNFYFLRFLEIENEIIELKWTIV